MTAKTFRRGVKLPENKHATEGKPIELVPPVKQVLIPINQHFGAPNKAIVNIGDKVIRGQKIADALVAKGDDKIISSRTPTEGRPADNPGPMTVPVHASISGTVKKIEPRRQSNNSEGLCIIIEADESDASQEQFLSPLDPFACSKEDALARIREAGIVGMGGAGFPTHIKLNPPAGKTIDTIIANGAECEPYLTTDEASMTESPNLLIKGLQIVMHITGVKNAIIGLEDNKKALIPIIEREIRLAKCEEISIGLCKTRYPQGGEKLLIAALTGREVPSGGLPMDAGCIVQNVGTLIAIAEAFTLGKPLVDRALTVTGGACKTPKDIRAPIGAILSGLPPEFMEVDSSKLAKIIFGGPMMGFAVPSLDIPIQKNTSGIVLMTREETIDYEETPCIRCGRCVRVCPCRLSPVLMNKYFEAEDFDGSVRVGLMDCTECGCCAYNCPARIKLVQRFRVNKQTLRARMAK